MTWDEFLNNSISDKTFVGQVRTDIECPKCGRKIYFDKTVVLTTYPAKYLYWCTCGWSDATAAKWEGAMHMRLTDADALLAEYDRVHVGPPGKARQLILDAPTVEPRPQWIPCSERLPEKRGYYLGYVINTPWRYAITVSFFPANSFYPGSEPSWEPDSETASNNVVAWMPLPEPYQEDK